jgi:hypothetical protein
MKALADPGHYNGRKPDLPGTPRRTNISPDNWAITGQPSTNLPSLPLLLEEVRADHHIQQALESSILFHFFSIKKNSNYVSIPRDTS